MQCEFCANVFTTKSNLNAHQKKAKYCLAIQGVQQKEDHVCQACDKGFYGAYELRRHLLGCKKKDRLSTYKDQLDKLKEENLLLKQEIEMLREQLRQTQESYENIATTLILNDKDKIVKLTKKYVRKRPRQQFDERNVVYIITTPSLKKERRYILGKATNLTNRLSTYNKTDEHEVVFYKSCNSKEMMSCIENMIFNKLSRYREQANRERFILPENQEISLFYNTIEECINFFS